MAQSKSFFGLRKGSTKNFTFTQLNGKQVTKERVEHVKNPRTQAQMAQRMLMTTAGAAYKYFKSIADHSFEGKTVGNQSMSEFMRLNLNKLRAAYVAGEKHAYNAYKDADINPYTYILAKGSLDKIAFGFDNSNIVASFNAESVATAEEIYAALGAKSGELITFVGVKGHTSVINGVYYYYADALKIVRLYCNKTGSVDKPLDAFVIESNQSGLSVNVSYDEKVLKILLADVDFGTVIRSRQESGTWKRSDATMQGNTNIIADVDVSIQLATYPISSELILNGGEMNAVGSAAEGSSLIPLSLSLDKSSVSITTANGTAQAPELKGNLGSGAVTYADYDTSIATVSSNGLITAKGNGTTTVTIKVASDGTYAASSIKFTVNVTGQGTAGGGDNTELG